MEEKTIPFDQKTKMERYMPIVDEVIKILKRMQEREQKIERIGGRISA